MRLVTFQTETALGPVRRLGSLDSDRVVDVQIAYSALLKDQRMAPDEAGRLAVSTLPSDMEQFISAAPASLAAAAQAVEFAREAGEPLRGPADRPAVLPLAEVRFLPPLTRPNSLRDFIAFEDHAEAGAARRGEELAPVWYERPIYYKGNHRSLLGHDADLPRPPFTRELDFELEVACVLGAGGRNLDEEQAAQTIFGFAIMNDWSARDVQRVEMAARLGPAKSKDFATSLGPCLLTADETGAHPALAMTARLNGRTVCEANLGDAHWTFPKMIAFVSQSEDVYPTDIYGSGTPRGGCLLDRGGPWLQPGDLVELEVEKIGVLRNRVV